MWLPTWASVVVVVRHKLRQLYISRRVWHGTTKFYRSLQTGRTYNHTGYDVTIYFQSEVIGVWKTVENDASDLFNVDSPNLAHTSKPTSWTARPDMMSLSTSGWQLSKFKNGRKCCLRRLRCRVSLEPFFIARITKFDRDIPTYCPALHLHHIWRHYTPVGSYRAKPSKMPPPDGFRWNIPKKV